MVCFDLSCSFSYQNSIMYSLENLVSLPIIIITSSAPVNVNCQHCIQPYTINSIDVLCLYYADPLHLLITVRTNRCYLLLRLHYLAWKPYCFPWQEQQRPYDETFISQNYQSLQNQYSNMPMEMFLLISTCVINPTKPNFYLLPKSGVRFTHICIPTSTLYSKR